MATATMSGAAMTFFTARRKVTISWEMTSAVMAWLKIGFQSCTGAAGAPARGAEKTKIVNTANWSPRLQLRS